MRYLELREQLNDFLIFSLNDIRKIEPSFHHQRLNEWQGKGYIKKIVNEYYVFSDTEISESVLFAIANKIYDPSYVSLEMALSFHQLIPESVYGVTSVTSRKTYDFSTSLARFSYRKIKPELMFGYRLDSFEKHTCKIAEPEKAILDYFYLNPKLETTGDFEELRINKDSFQEQVDTEKLKKYLAQYNSKALEKRVNRFIKYIDHA
jgi:predicted transcriptional regulator of viral defense system